MLTGSSTLGLLDAAADTLAGRISIQSLPPACWGEELGPPTHAVLTRKASPTQIKEGNRLLAQAMTFGQFPEILTCDTGQEKLETLNRYKNTYFTRDLMQLSNTTERNLRALRVLHGSKRFLSKAESTEGMIKGLFTELRLR